MKSRNKIGLSLRLFAALSLAAFSGCAYYNYYYNAQKNYDAAEKQRQDASSRNPRRGSSAGSGYTKSISSAEKMLEYYPGSQWEDDAILLIAKSNYREGKYRSAAGRADELLARFPDSPLAEEASLYKGISLLRLAQPDSARQILGEIFLKSHNKSFIAQGHYGLGEYYLIEKRPETALTEFRAAAQSSVDDIWLRGQSWVKAGETLSLLEMYDQAVDLYDEILREKVPRRLRFEASLQRATALRECHRPEEALELCETLLKDGAFVDDFPLVELEAAKCFAAIGKNAEAQERLEKLVEVEKRGEVGAEGQYLLGLYHWQINHNDTAALSALQAVKVAERTAKIVPKSDSLAAEIEALMKFYRKLRFLDRKLSLIDSARQGLRAIYPADTAWVDSSQIAKSKASKSKEKASKKKSRDARGKSRIEAEIDAEDPIQRMVDAAIAADPSQRANLINQETSILDTVARDSSLDLVPIADTVRVPLDSLQLASVDSLFRRQQKDNWLALAELHLFDRNDFDSASIYIDTLLATNPDSILWARGTATAAYIAKSQLDTTKYDSLYRLILENPPDISWKRRAERALNIESNPPPATQTAALIDSAESIWRDQDDAESARLLYLLAAEVADSGDTAGARALLAAAFITRTVLGQDSLALQLYGEISSKFSGTPYGKAAQKHGPKGARRVAAPVSPDLKAPPSGKDSSPYDEMDDYLGEMPAGPVVYDAAKVDEPPTLIVSTQTVDDYLRSYYPFEAYAERMEGTVELKFIVRANGEVTDIELVKADPEGFGFDEAALQVAAMLAFRPGRNQGNPVDVRMLQSLRFKYPEDR